MKKFLLIIILFLTYSFHIIADDTYLNEKNVKGKGFFCKLVERNKKPIFYEENIFIYLTKERVWEGYILWGSDESIYGEREYKKIFTYHYYINPSYIKIYYSGGIGSGYIYTLSRLDLSLQRIAKNKVKAKYQCEMLHNEKEFMNKLKIESKRENEKVKKEAKELLNKRIF